MERIIIEYWCDQCKKSERLPSTLLGQAFYDWRSYNVDGKTINFCSARCERIYLEKRLDTMLRAIY